LKSIDHEDYENAALFFGRNDRSTFRMVYTIGNYGILEVLTNKVIHTPLANDDFVGASVSSRETSPQNRILPWISVVGGCCGSSIVKGCL
jgi:hypothetical protein